MSTAPSSPLAPCALPTLGPRRPHLHRVDAALGDGPRQGPSHKSLVNPQSLLVTPHETLDLEQRANEWLYPRDQHSCPNPRVPPRAKTWCPRMSGPGQK